MRGLQSRQKERRRGHARSRQGECASWNRKRGPWYTISCTGARPASACHSATLSALLAGALPAQPCPAGAASRLRLSQAPHSQCRRHLARNDASCGGLVFPSREAAAPLVTACRCSRTGERPEPGRSSWMSPPSGRTRAPDGRSVRRAGRTAWPQLRPMAHDGKHDGRQPASPRGAQRMICPCLRDRLLAQCRTWPRNEGRPADAGHDGSGHARRHPKRRDSPQTAPETPLKQRHCPLHSPQRTRGGMLP